MGWKEGTNLEISALPNSIVLRQVVEPKLQPVDPVDEGEPKPKRKSSSTRTRKKPRV
jgi:hypothetical protein